MNDLSRHFFVCIKSKGRGKRSDCIGEKMPLASDGQHAKRALP